MEDYLQTLIWTMFFVVMVEMIFPNSDMKKYLKLVLSFIVLFIVISPLVKEVIGANEKGIPSFSEYVSYYQESLGQEVTYSNYEDERDKQQEGMRKIYEEQLAKQAQGIIEQNVQVEVYAIDVETEGEEVTAMTVDVGYKDEVGIGISIGKKNESIVLDKDILEKEIKKCLNDFYNWDNTNIYITVQEN